MAIGNEVITSELEKEGINVDLGKGLSFETPEDLTAWVETYKSVLPPPEKKLQDYTKEELEEIAKVPDFKGAKGLQGLLDSVRQKQRTPAPAPTPTNPTPPTLEIPDDIKAQLASINDLKAKLEAQDFEKMVSTQCIKAGFSDADDIEEITSKLKPDATKEDVAAKIEAHKAYLTKKGVKAIGSPGGGGRTGGAIEKIAKDYVAKEKARKEKFNKK